MKQKKGLFPYTIGEDISHAVSHGVGAIFAYIGLIYLVFVASTQGTVIDVVAFAIYGTTLLTMFLMSTIYHSLQHKTSRTVFKRLDHVAIFLLISGTYAPLIGVINTPKVYFVFAIVVLLSIAGIIFKSLFAGRYNRLMVALYLILG